MIYDLFSTGFRASFMLSRVLHTRIPFPLFVFSPGLIIQVFWKDEDFWFSSPEKQAKKLEYSGSDSLDMLKVNGILENNESLVISLYVLSVWYKPFLLVKMLLNSRRL